MAKQKFYTYSLDIVILLLILATSIRQEVFKYKLLNHKLPLFSYSISHITDIWISSRIWTD